MTGKGEEEVNSSDSDDGDIEKGSDAVKRNVSEN